MSFSSPIRHNSCCTCASLLDSTTAADLATEKSLGEPRALECCTRVICAPCISKNPRFATYCPFCQISTIPTSIPQALRDPPAYTTDSSPRPPSPSPSDPSIPPPPYTSHPTSAIFDTSSNTSPSSTTSRTLDIIHYIHPSDTLASLSVAYSTPVAALRATNGLYADHLLAGRRTIAIPRKYYSGASQSPRSLCSAEEEARKAALRRWMVRCKVHDYEIAVLYLQQADYNLDTAIETYLADDLWEKENPLQSRSQGKRKLGAKR